MAHHRPFLKDLLLWGAVLGLAAGASLFWWYRTTRVAYRFQRGREALARGDWDEAERLAVRLENSGHEDHAHLLRGKIYYGQARPLIEGGQLEGARPLLERALREFNQLRDQGEILLDAAGPIGVCLLHLQSPSEAERTFLFVVKQQPDNLDAHRGLAALYYDHGALASAVMHCQEWARLDPQDGRPHRFMGHIYQDLEDYPEAATHFRAALERRLGERFAQDVRENLAAVLVKQSQYAEALDVLAGSEAGVESPQELALRAECLLGLRRTEEARRLLNQALTANPEFVSLLRLRAQLHLQEQEWQAAASLLESALKFDRHDLVVRQLLAQVYELLGRGPEAAEQTRRSQEIQDGLKKIAKLSREAMQGSPDPFLCRRLAELYEEFDKPEVAAMWRRAATELARAPGVIARPPASPLR